VDERIPRRPHEAGGLDQILREPLDRGLLRRIRGVVDASAVEAVPLGRVENVPLEQEVIEGARPRGSEVVHAPPVRIDTRTRDARVAGVRVQLAQKEYELLLRLAREPERVFTKAELLRDVWGYRASARTRTLDSHASRLRRKLREAGAPVALVENVWGVGYRLLGVMPLDV